MNNKYGPTIAQTHTCIKPHAEIIHPECRLLARCAETVCRCDMGGREAKRMLIWDSCIEHRVGLKQAVIGTTIKTILLFSY